MRLVVIRGLLLSGLQLDGDLASGCASMRCSDSIAARPSWGGQAGIVPHLIAKTTSNETLPTHGPHLLYPLH